MSIRSPKDCVQPLCDFFLGINDNSADKNVLDFTLEGKAKGWVAVAFSKTPNMVNVILHNRMCNMKMIFDNSS